jgi:hypothetical protein
MIGLANGEDVDLVLVPLMLLPLLLLLLLLLLLVVENGKIVFRNL